MAHSAYGPIVALVSVWVSLVPAAAANSPAVVVLGDDVAFALTAPPPLREPMGYFDGGTAGLRAEAGSRLLHVATPPGEAVLGRVVDTALGATPLLSWYWRVSPTSLRDPGAQDLPLELLVGFSGGGPLLAPVPQARLPVFARAVTIVWSWNAWEAGAAEARGPYGRVVAHGGPPDGGWWEQALDLGAIHHRLWPDIALDRVRIAFVAVAARASCQQAAGEVADVTLMR